MQAKVGKQPLADIVRLLGQLALGVLLYVY
jgi:hypothetical protein